LRAFSSAGPGTGLPYRLDATREQFTRAYPEAAEFSALKASVDPGKRFRNLLWDAYLPDEGVKP